MWERGIIGSAFEGLVTSKGSTQCLLFRGPTIPLHLSTPARGIPYVLE